MSGHCLSPERPKYQSTESLNLAKASLSKSSHQMVKTIPRISISDSLQHSRNTKSLENLQMERSELEIPYLIKPVDRNQRKASLADWKHPVQNSRRLSVNIKLANQIQAGGSPSRRVSVFSQLSDLIITSRSNSMSRASNAPHSLARRKHFISCINLCCIRSVVVITIVIIVIFFYKFHYYLANKDE